MDPVLVNRCVMDEKTLRKTYALVFRRNLMLFYLGSGLITAMALLMIGLQGISPMSVVLLIGGAAYLILGLRQPKKQAKLQILRYEQSGSGSSPEVTVWFDPEELTGRRSGSDTVTNISYDSIKAVLPGQNHIVLWTEEKQFIVLDCARFVNGNEDDFWLLMNQRCRHALPKSKLRN